MAFIPELGLLDTNYTEIGSQSHASAPYRIWQSMSCISAPRSCLFHFRHDERTKDLLQWEKSSLVSWTAIMDEEGFNKLNHRLHMHTNRIGLCIFQKLDTSI
jgi:hypothetical protein